MKYVKKSEISRAHQTWRGLFIILYLEQTFLCSSYFKCCLKYQRSELTQRLQFSTPKIVHLLSGAKTRSWFTNFHFQKNPSHESMHNVLFIWNIATIANAVQVTLLSLSLSLSLKSLSKVSQRSLKSLSKVSQKSLKCLSKVSQKSLLVSTMSSTTLQCTEDAEIKSLTQLMSEWQGHLLSF